MAKKGSPMSSGAGLICNLFPRLGKAIKASGGSNALIEKLGSGEPEVDSVITAMAAVAVKRLRPLCLPTWLQEQSRFYKEVFSVDVDFSNLNVLAEVPTGKWPIVTKDLTYGQLWEAVVRWEAYRKRPGPYRYADFSKIDMNAELRDAHCVLVGNHVEATAGDSHLQLLSAEAVKAGGHPTQNLMQRLVLDMFVDWCATQEGKVQLLDQKDWTLTSSRWSAGYVVGVNRGGDQLRVDWYVPRYAYPHLRARAAISV